MSAKQLAYRLFFEWSERGLCEHAELLTAGVETYQPATVFELGVRTGVSSAIFLAAIDRFGGQLWSADLDLPHGPYVYSILGHPAWTFISGDTGNLDTVQSFPAECDILFTDTSHEYVQTYIELCNWSPKVKPSGVILIHDVNVKDAEVGDEIGFPVRRAISLFIEKHPEWSVDYTTDRFGLGILERHA